MSWSRNWIYCICSSAFGIKYVLCEGKLSGSTQDGPNLKCQEGSSQQTKNPCPSHGQSGQVKRIREYTEVLGSNHNAHRHSHGYWVGTEVKKLHDSFSDPIFQRSLPIFFKDEGNVQSIIDVGAGTGELTSVLAAHGFFVNCYDGNPATQEISGGRCGILDFSQPLNLPSVYDWVICLKIGKHVPREFEETFLRNLDRLNSKGIIISWGGFCPPVLDPGSNEPSPFNERTDEEIIELFQGMGYVHDLKAEAKLRNMTHPRNSLRSRLLVFRKQ